MWGRLRQVAYYVAPRLLPADRAWAEGLLNPAQRSLFAAMGPQDQAHVVRVARRLEAAGAPAFALEAALLHDCAKPRDYGLFWRSAGVLFAPLLAGMPSEPRRTGLVRHLQTYRWHDQWSLALAAQAGTSAEALALLRAYLLGEGDAPWLAALRESDDRG